MPRRFRRRYRSRRHSALLLLMTAVVAVAAVHARHGITGPQGPTQTTAVASPAVNSSTNPDLEVLAEPQTGYSIIDQFITTARRSVYLTMYELADPTVEAALAGDAARGVDVRVILDQNLERAHNQAAYRDLTGHGAHVAWADPSYAATHQKTLTVDGTETVILTGNLVAADYATTRDFVVVDHDQADISAVTATFQADFASRSTTPPAGTDLVWSPTTAQSDLLTLINGATRSLAVENEEMNDTAVTDALAAAARRGVNVTVTMTANRSWDRAFAQLRTAGVHVRLFPDRQGVLYIHAKTITADTGLQTARAFVGSENFSTASLTRNRELGVVTAYPPAVDALSSVVNADQAAAQP